MLRELLEKQQTHAAHFFASLDLVQAEHLVELLLNCSGMLFFTGIGKSGLVAKKIAFTMVSTGTRAFYLSPTDALHGDLGMVSERDLFIILSKSGESDELLNLVPAIRNRGATLVAIVCNSQSRLAAVCDYIFTLPFNGELCPFDMAPTMSTTFQLLFGDLLAIALMRRKNFGLDQYALNHPSGAIGKRMTLRVSDLMLTDSQIPICRPQDSLSQVLVELTNKRCGCILVSQEDKTLLGVFTDGDLRRALQKHSVSIIHANMEDLMTSHPRTISSDTLAWEALQQMEGDGTRCISILPVVDKAKRIVGLLHLHDLIRSGL